MSLTAPATAPSLPSLRLVTAAASTARTSSPWWERRAMLREIVGGCPDHWWKATAPTTAACTCNRF